MTDLDALPDGDVDMAEAATWAGLGYERFRKTWRGLVRRLAFPTPFRERPYLWRRDQLRAWRRDRQAAIREQVLITPPANDHVPKRPAAPPASLNKGRAAAGRARLCERLQAL